MTEFLTSAASAPLVASLACIFAIYAWMRRNTARSRRRARQLRVAHDLLDQHLRALAKLVDSPVPPDRLKELLLTFSSVIAEREQSLALLHSIFTNGKLDKSASENLLLKELTKLTAALQASNPELLDAYETAITSGFGAMVLRWDETADMFDIMVAKALVDRRKEAVFFTRAVNMGIDRQRGTGVGLAPNLALAGGT